MIQDGKTEKVKCAKKISLLTLAVKCPPLSYYARGMQVEKHDSVDVGAPAHPLKAGCAASAPVVSRVVLAISRMKLVDRLCSSRCGVKILTFDFARRLKWKDTGLFHD